MADLAHNGSFLFYVLAAIGLCSIMIGLAAFLGGKAKGRSKNTPFESVLTLSALHVCAFPQSFISSLCSL